MGPLIFVTDTINPTMEHLNLERFMLAANSTTYFIKFGLGPNILTCANMQTVYLERSNRGGVYDCSSA